MNSFVPDTGELDQKHSIIQCEILQKYPNIKKDTFQNIPKYLEFLKKKLSQEDNSQQF